VKKAFPTLDKKKYLYNWTAVNTRSFYYEVKNAKKKAPNDCMAVCPFMDYINHADEGVRLIVLPKLKLLIFNSVQSVMVRKDIMFKQSMTMVYPLV
jgi:hypothetical protein